MTFFIKNTGVPDRFGGIAPFNDSGICVNRSGGTRPRGDLVMLDFTAVSTEITTNDSNSYLPGYGDASGDSVWNTIIAPTATALDTGAIFGVVTAKNGILDNESGEVQFFGVVEAFCISAATMTPGDPLTGTTASNLDGVIATNEAVIAHYLSPEDASVSVRARKRVFLHNGLFGGTGTVA
jgi:hypothetical protein